LRTRTMLNGLILIGLSVVLTQGVMAAPLDLQDPTPRWIEVRFEVSPKEEPGRLNGAWSSPRSAFIESGPDKSAPDNATIRIRIPTREIEAHLLATGTEPVPGSFSDFVWTFDARTGHVLTAHLSGRVRQRFSLGPILTSATVEIRVDMTTRDIGGFRPVNGILGLQTNAFCLPSAQSPQCVAVDPIRFDPESGYVNAVGSLVAAAPIAEIRTFSPLGEARFSERHPQGSKTVVSGTSRADAVCLYEFIGPCWADLGGES